MPRALATLLLAALALGGCGYSTRGNLPDHIKSVAVPIFKNRTAQGGLETVITSGVVNAFSGRLRVVPPDQADSILEGEITGYNAEGLAFSRTATITAYRITYSFSIEFRDLRRNVVLWKDASLTATSDFAVQGSVADSIAREVGASGQVAEEVGRRIVNAALDRF